MNKILNLLAPCGDWLAPRQCGLCARALATNGVICPDCQRALPWNKYACRRCALPIERGQICGACLSHPPVFEQCIVPFRYEPPISTLIIQLKFQQKLRCARILGELLGESIQNQANKLPECIIPVPLHTQRIRQRGFNQAVEIARPLSKRFNIPLLYAPCYRRKNTRPQSQLSAQGRRRNLKAAFGLQKNIPFQHVAIIDDVMTTGQTVRVLSQLLHREGVQKIEVWCCARAI